MVSCDSELKPKAIIRC